MSDTKNSLFYQSEELSKDFNLFPSRNKDEICNHIRGLVKYSSAQADIKELRSLASDDYIERAIGLLESTVLPSAVQLIANLGLVSAVTHKGPYYSATLRLTDGDTVRDVGVIAQDRSSNSGVWMPEHHIMANKQAREFVRNSLPIVSFIDTPGAEANDLANKHNQAHHISDLIATMGSLQVPSIGIIYGLGYSGGAIPFATANINFALRGSAFSTIQPKGLSSIARRYNLSWERCAQIVGISASQLWEDDIVDGVIDYSVNDSINGNDEKNNKDNVTLAILSALQYLERFCTKTIVNNTYLNEYYFNQINRQATLSKKSILFRKSLNRPDENDLIPSAQADYPNVFGFGFRYMRYLNLRKKLTSIPLNQLGDLRENLVPDNDKVVDKNKQDLSIDNFIKWAQDSGKILYQPNYFSKEWNKLCDSYADTLVKGGKLKRLLFGTPQERYAESLVNVPKLYTSLLYLQWKDKSFDNLLVLRSAIHDRKLLDNLITVDMIDNADKFSKSYVRDAKELIEGTKEWSKKSLYLIKEFGLSNINKQLTTSERSQIVNTIAFECNKMILRGANRNDICKLFKDYIKIPPQSTNSIDPYKGIETLLEVVGVSDLNPAIDKEIVNVVIFDKFYDYLISQFDLIAIGGLESNSINSATLEKIYEAALEYALKEAGDEIKDEKSASNSFVTYLSGLKHKQGRLFLNHTQEWKRALHPRLSETLFVILTDILERIIPKYLEAKKSGKEFDGDTKFNPHTIGKIKDFWNRLTVAFQDLRIEKLLATNKKQYPVTPTQIIKRFFIDFQEIMADRVSNDPCSFPGFRNSIKKAIEDKETACGLVAGIGVYHDGKKKYKVGAVISNPQFQAGSFDMASGEKFCKVLAECSKQNIPLIGFISSGGMQTKEGAGSLFSMSVVNDKITRFVEDFDIPIILFGFGDCTGGAQASFVTHPKVFNYYFSGTNMPFAGQIVVPSYLSYRSTLSNYLLQTKGAMEGLVRHPFILDFDDNLKLIDPSIPVASESVESVISRIVQGENYSQNELASEIEYSDVDSTSAKTIFKPIKKVLIHARGCTASKLIRIAQKEKIKVVLVQSDPDMTSAPADQLNIDNGDVLVALGGNTSDESYLNGLSVILVAEREGADALHPGIGFLSENPNFAKLCRSHNINFIGPHVSTMEIMGNKSNAVNTAIKNKVPVVPGSHGILPDSSSGASIANEIGYPILIKAVHGGGGKGIKIVEQPENFISTYQQVSLEARNAFGSGELYLEKYVNSIRHIEAQILRDSKGNCHIIGIRDCSVQREKQKVIEESDSTMLTAKLRKVVVDSAKTLANAVDYIGAGTVEFIYDLTNSAIYFMEMNTRLQVEHPVTEKVSGVDIVAQQFRIASGKSIKGLKIQNKGYSIEVRVTAEKISKSSSGSYIFKADPGLVLEFNFPKDPKIDVIPAVSGGKTISPYYDSLIAQVIVHHTTRLSAIDYLIKYLSKATIKGVSTNIPLLIKILKDEIYRKGKFDTNYMEEFLNRVDTDLIAALMNKDGSAVKIDKSQIEIADSEELKVLSPSTGIFYSSSSPLDPPFLNEGDIFSCNQTICLVEAMKVFSPLKLDDYIVGDKKIYGF